MSDDEIPDAARSALQRHDAFDTATDSTFEATTTPLGARVTAVPATAEGRDARFVVTVELPTLDAVTEESVAEPVEDGWFDTLSLRFEDAYDVPEVDPVDEPSIDREGDRVVATFRFRAWSADRGVDDAKAIIDFVEGTYVQGVIPGYTYQDPAKGLLKRAQEQAGDEGSGGAERGGTPL